MSFEKPIWAEGIFLSQQHFQQWDLYHEQNQKICYQHIFSPCYGIIKLKIDTNSLLSGVFRVQYCEVIYPNGQYIIFEENDWCDLSCKLREDKKGKSNIYLCAARNEQVSNISGYPSTTQITKYNANYRTTKDIYDHQREREILYGRLNLLLANEDDLRENFLSLKIAELTVGLDNEFQLDKQFIPAITRIQASSVLLSLLQRIYETINIKAKDLKQRCKQYNGFSISPTDYSAFILLQSLNSMLPIIYDWLLQMTPTPYEIYKRLLEFLGRLSIFDPNNEFPQQPHYQQEKLTEIFHQLEICIKSTVEKIIPAQLPDINLQRTSETQWLAENIEEKLLDKTALYLAVKFMANENAWINQFSMQLKIASLSNIEMVLSNAVSGIKIIHKQGLPKNLAIKSGYEYFYIEPDNYFWAQIKAEKNLAIFVPKKFSTAKLEIITLLDIE